MDPIVNDKDIKSLLKLDPVFKNIHDLYGPPPNWNRPPGFESLVRIILEQNVSLQSGLAHFNKLNGYIKSFSPSEILKLSDEEMRLCQMSKQKSSYLRELSSAILEQKLDLDQLPNLPTDEIRNQLKSIKGIGDWTTDIYLIFCLQSKDIFPIGDLAVVATIKELTKVTNRQEILERSEIWKPYRSLAAFYLWHYYRCKRMKVVD